MRKEFKLNTPSLVGGSELVVMATIKPGFVPALDSVTYKTRAKLLLKALHSGRKNSHEFQLFRAMSDAVERIGVIHSVRVAVLEPENKILLSVNVDGSYEAYVRVIWQKSARLLDLIFCNTVDHVTGWDHSYEAWSAWLRRVQVEVPFFYAPPQVTAPDQSYWRMLERQQQRGAFDLQGTRLAIPSAEQVAWDVVRQQIDPQNGPQAKPPQSVVGSREAIRQGLQGLVGLYRLADLYPPGTHDGLLLHRAARELLPEFSRMQALGAEYGDVIADAGKRFPEPLAWLGQDQEPVPAVRVPPPLPTALPTLPAGAQAGILQAYGGITHAALGLLAFDDAAAAAAFLAHFPTTAQGDSLADGAPRWNLAFTLEGLRRCGLPESLLEALPLEFRQGMEQRAGLLGDVRGNHPRRWRLPLRNGPQVLNDPQWTPGPNPERVALEAVHVLVQVRMGPANRRSRSAASGSAQAGCVAGGFAVQPAQSDLRPALSGLLKALLATCPGTRLLSLQWMQRLGNQDNKAVDHFGYTDGQSQPEFQPREETVFYPNQVHLGEALLGHDNAADQAHDLGVLHPLLQDGSFLVVRKLRQDVAALEAAINTVVEHEGTAPDATLPALTPAVVLAKMMGRWHPRSGPLAGLPLVTYNPVNPNDFNYRGDTNGAQCPLAAHVRRANPRPIHSTDIGQVQPLPGARTPRLLRRGMPYGEPRRSGKGGAARPDEGDRGLVFMAYNSSIAEQFETVQRWLAGGNSSGTASGATDPFLGVPESGRTRMFGFEYEGRHVRMALDGNDALGEDPRPLVALEWGAYALAPALPGLHYLHQQALAAAKRQAPQRTSTYSVSSRVDVAWSAFQGRAEILQLQALEQSDPEQAAAAWKAALEDPEALSSYRSASIWAAIRADHGGVLRVPYGVLVADRAGVDAVLANTAQRYSVQGYQERLQASIGAIYLGLDAKAALAEPGEYERQSKACNAAIMALSGHDGFVAARAATQAALFELSLDAVAHALFGNETGWELNLDVRELLDRVLAALIEKWFGLRPGSGEFEFGGFQWNWKPGQPPLLPGHFNAPSRYTFQPAPGPLVQQVAERHGQALTRAVADYLARFGPQIGAPVTRAVLDQTPAPSLDLAARTLTGAIMGFVPTTEGSVRRVLQEWLRDGSLWALRNKTAPAALATLPAAKAALFSDLARAMQTRPVPEQIWRTATAAHTLGSGAHAVPVQAGDTVVLALVSATHQAVEAGDQDLTPIFGGPRSAAPGAPTHACPAYPAAMGVMLGLLSAIVDWPPVLRVFSNAARSAFAPVSQPGTELELLFPTVLRAGPAPGVLSFGGDLPSAPAKPPPVLAHYPNETPTRSRLLVWGDSWFNNPYPQPGLGQWDLGVFLRQLGYRVDQQPQRARAGMALAEMAQVAANDPDSLYSDVHRALFENELYGQPLPLAIVMDGGGNDVHRGLDPAQAPLSQMLQPYGTLDGDGHPLIFDEQVVQAFIDGQLARDWDLILGRLTHITQGRIPILVHGYDHPIPDGRAYFGNWLHRSITGVRGYDAASDGPAIMMTLIDRLNHMLATVTAPYQALGVHHVALTGVLAAQPGFAADYKTYWLNELHPNDKGFAALAQVLHLAIQRFALTAAVSQAH